MSLEQRIDQMAAQFLDEIALMGLRARLDLKELAERHNRSRGQINRWIRKRFK